MTVNETTARYWDFRTDGDEVVICVSDTRRNVAVSSGKVCLLVIEGMIGDERRTIWAWPKALSGQLLDELDKRDALAFEPGERIKIARGREVESRKHPGWMFRLFTVECLDRPEPEADPRYSIPY